MFSVLLLALMWHGRLRPVKSDGEIEPDGETLRLVFLLSLTELKYPDGVSVFQSEPSGRWTLLYSSSVEDESGISNCGWFSFLTFPFI